MWRSQSDLLVMAREHNRDLVRQAEADRLSRHLSGTLMARIKNWWTRKHAINRTGIPDAPAESLKEDLRRVTDHDQFNPAYRTVHPVES
jgi:hypothetical protein